MTTGSRTQLTVSDCFRRLPLVSAVITSFQQGVMLRHGTAAPARPQRCGAGLGARAAPPQIGAIYRKPVCTLAGSRLVFVLQGGPGTGGRTAPL